MHQINTIPCPHCGARYKAPLTIPQAGGLITCAKCGETFTIFPEKKKEEVIKPKDEHIYKQLPDDPFSNIFVMKEDGSIIAISSQALLQQKIVKMEVGKNDSWSKDKKQWLPLATEDELAPFFDLVSLKLTVGESIAPAPQALPPISFNSDDEIETPFRAISKTIPPQSITKEVGAPPKKVENNFSTNEFDDFDFDEEKKSPVALFAALFVVILLVASGGIYFFTDLFNSPNTTVDTPQKVEPQPEQLPTMPAKATVVATPDTAEKKVEPQERVAAKSVVVEKKIAPIVQKPVKTAPPKKIAPPKKQTPKKQVSAKALARYGWKLLNRGRNYKAIKIFKKAIKKKPAYADSYYGLAEAYGALGNTAKAKQYYREFLKHNPPPAQKNEVQTILNNL